MEKHHCSQKSSLDGERHRATIKEKTHIATWKGLGQSDRHEEVSIYKVLRMN